MSEVVRQFRLTDVKGASSPDLLRECGHRLTDPELWEEFQRRFQRRIFLYLLRACHISSGRQDRIREVILDLAQDVYVRLVQNDGRILQSFRGKSEFAVKAFLARITSSVVVDHFRYHMAEKRQAQVISIDHEREVIENARVGTDLDAKSVGALLPGSMLSGFSRTTTTAKTPRETS